MPRPGARTRLRVGRTPVWQASGNGQTASHRGGDDMAQRHREPVDVHLILRRGGEVLLSRRAGDTYASGLLHTPSGHLDGDFEDVVAGLVNASLVLPEATETYFPHMSAAYGKVATHYANQMDRADALASALLRHARHHMTVRVKSVWLVMETQHPDRHTYTFERIQELPLGR